MLIVYKLTIDTFAYEDGISNAKRRITIPYAKTNLCGKEYLDSAINTYESEVENPHILKQVNTARTTSCAE